MAELRTALERLPEKPADRQPSIALADAGGAPSIAVLPFVDLSPATWECRWCRLALVELLLDRGADMIEAGPNRGPHRSRGPNGGTMRGLPQS